MITYECITPNDRIEPDDINRLWGQLTAKSNKITKEDITLVTMLSHLLVVRDDSRSMQGMATLGVVPTLHGTIGLVEDVVVDASLRGQHVGEGLMTRLVELATRSEVNQLKLSSRPERVAANQLYQKLGFKLDQPTNHYTLTL